MKVTLNQAQTIIDKGGIIAYPTETTFGLGCNALSETAIQRLNKIKQRSADKGFITLINDHQQLKLLIQPLTQEQLQAITEKWPGPYTFVFPALTTLPKLLTGNRSTIAIRISSHPVAHALCQNQPITSTSANISNQNILKNAEEIEHIFGCDIDGIIDRPTGNHPPSAIIDALTGHKYR